MRGICLSFRFRGFEENMINRMELSACIAALKWVREEALTRRGYSRVQVFGDSQDVVSGQTSALFWQKAQWRNSSGRPVENSNLWKDFLSAKAKAGIRVEICKVASESAPMLKQRYPAPKREAEFNNASGPRILPLPPYHSLGRGL